MPARAPPSTHNPFRVQICSYPTIHSIPDLHAFFLPFDEEELGPTRLPPCRLYFLGSFLDIFVGSLVPIRGRCG